eukprot:CAMPEP_0117608440 /NCGR_PEP_ID=MMETSP0784-20121206/80810_1 /TAXON_ID=39447 /ORGANISM="" /LENGTH=119 /DNA_ID=CAMNT_0005411715 /DNA_START=35 /DNA_END=394 /DNA_ORIENTATION=+
MASMTEASRLARITRFAARKPSGALLATCSATLKASASNASRGRDRDASPICTASLLLIGRAVKIISAAAEGPINRGSITAPPAPGKMPRRASGKQSVASFATKRTSAQSAISSPQPKA